MDLNSVTIVHAQQHLHAAETPRPNEEAYYDVGGKWVDALASLNRVFVACRSLVARLRHHPLPLVSHLHLH